MAINASAGFHSPEGIVSRRWILVCLIVAEMVLSVLRVRIIWIFRVVVRLAIPEGCVTKTSMNVPSRRRVVMVLPVETPTDLISVSAPRATKVVTVRLTRMIAHHSPVKTVELVWMGLEIIPAFAWMALRVSIAKSTSTSVSRCLVKMGRPVHST